MRVRYHLYPAGSTLPLAAASIVCAIAFSATRPSEAAALSMGAGLFLAVAGAGLLIGAALVLMQVGHPGNQGTFAGR